MLSLAVILATLRLMCMEIRDTHVTVEIADTVPSQKQGLMFRKALDPDHGMLFVYKQPEILSFWMQNTQIPLSIGFFDAEQRLLQIEDMNPPVVTSHIPIYQSKTAAKYALEVPQHWFQEHGIQLGDRFTLREVP
jgi:uncharacterized membrane protein (UPF0127 family)